MVIFHIEGVGDYWQRLPHSAIAAIVAENTADLDSLAGRRGFAENLVENHGFLEGQVKDRPNLAIYLMAESFTIVSQTKALKFVYSEYSEYSSARRERYLHPATYGLFAYHILNLGG